MRVLVFLAAACSLAGAADPREIVRRSTERMDENLAVARNYTFLERSETRELDSDGHVKTRKILLYDVTLLEGSPYRRLVGKDDHPLSQDEERGEEKKLQASIADRRKETPEQHARRIAEWEKKRRREREPLDEIPDGFDFRLAGEEQIDGRDVWVIEAAPRPGYHARSSLAKLFPKFRGKLWIDKADQQWVKTEAEAIDNISFGWFVARLSKGARLEVQMTRVNGEVWLPKRIEAHGSARLVLVRNFRVAAETSFSNYRKFQTDSRIVAITPQP
jgi:hypothetical protein